MPKYIAQSEIRGLEDPKKLKDGVVQEHVLKEGDAFEMDADEAEPFVKGGALKLAGPTDAEAKAADRAARDAADAEIKRRAALTPAQRKAEDDDAAAAKGGQ